MITLGLLGYLFYTNWRLTICIMVFLPVIGILVRKASKECANSMQVQDTMGDVNHVVQESINGNAVVKVSLVKSQNKSVSISHRKKT